MHSSNLMVWPTSGAVRPRLWLIDHGAALVFHHRWGASPPEKAYDFPPSTPGHPSPDPGQPMPMARRTETLPRSWHGAREC
ncbi:hypothetical protein [Streptomyces sp. DHE17-7]|uniref:hypothetical protein n=1 Tax=Streptomyces sp. DHE17-7 TaxID=2759949 RepID=UPI003FA73535|nr:hypothetical protein [Streptomyces sp. DHE17-7]